MQRPTADGKSGIWPGYEKRPKDADIRDTLAKWPRQLNRHEARISYPHTLSTFIFYLQFSADNQEPCQGKPLTGKTETQTNRNNQHGGNWNNVARNGCRTLKKRENEHLSHLNCYSISLPSVPKTWAGLLATQVPKTNGCLVCQL